MRVNPKKTQLLSISPAIHSEVRSFVCLEDGSEIESQDSLTLLGLCFGDRPTPVAHIALIEKKFNIQSWIIRHLKQAVVPNLDTASVFASTIRPVIEYGSPVYHWMLTGQHSEILERMQRRCLKIFLDTRHLTGKPWR